MSSVEAFILEQAVWISEMLPLIVVSFQGKIHSCLTQLVPLPGGE